MHKSLVGTSSRWPCCARSLHIPHLKSHHLNQLPTKDSGKAIKPCWRLPSGRAAFTDKCSSNRTPCAVQAVRALHKPSNRGQLLKTFCEPHSYHERPHIYADDPSKADIRLTLGKERALAGAEHPKALNALYFMYAFACLVERAWRFGLPLVLMDIPGGFQSVAVVGFVAPLAVAVLGPATGQLLDSSPRQLALNFCAITQGVCITASGLLMWRAVQLGSAFSFQQSPLFLALLFFTMLERLTSFASDVAIERDWLTQLVGDGGQGALAEANAALRRMDQLAELLGTIAFGWCITHHSHLIVLPLISAVALVGLPLEVWAIHQVVKHAAGALTSDREQHTPVHGTALQQQPAARPDGRNALSAALAGIGESAESTLASWRLYFQQPVLPASLAYIMLHFNAVLSPGCLMTAFLSSRGLSGTAAAVFRAACAVMGFVGTWVGSALIASIGVLRTGVAALVLQAGSLAVAALIYRSHLAQASITQAGAAAAAQLGQVIAGVPVYTWLFCGMIVMSRVAFWVYDMVDAQIFQTAVPRKIVASVSSAEVSLCSLSELIMLGIAAVASEPGNFGLLVMLSSGTVIAAAVIYSVWAQQQPSMLSTDMQLADAS